MVSKAALRGGAIDEVAPASDLRVQAYIFARDDGFSVYDGSYLALAERLGVQLVTADDRLIERAQQRWRREAGPPAVVAACPPARAAGRSTHSIGRI